MRILAIDTACSAARAALTEDDRLLLSDEIADKRAHSVKLMPMLEKLLASCGLRPEQLDLIAVTNGPGSFTGLRIGVVTAKTLAYAADLPLIGINTLDALAASFNTQKGIVCPLIDARNTRAYGGFYREGTLLGNRFVRSCTETAEEAFSCFGAENVLFCGDGSLLPENRTLIRNMLPGAGFADAEETLGRTEEIARLARQRYLENPDGDYGCNQIGIDYMKDWL